MSPDDLEALVGSRQNDAEERVVPLGALRTVLERLREAERLKCADECAEVEAFWRHLAIISPAGNEEYRARSHTAAACREAILRRR